LLGIEALNADLVMKVCLLNSFYFPVEPGGAERSVRLLAESLVSAGHEVVVICLGDERSSESHNGVLIERLPIRNAYLQKPGEAAQAGAMGRLWWHVRDTKNAAAARDIREVLVQHQVDVLHTNNIAGFSVAVWAAAKSLNIPVVHTTRDFYLLCPKTTMMRGEDQCAGQCASCSLLSKRRISASADVDRYVGISSYIARKHKRFGAFEGVAESVIYNSFPEQKPIPLPEEGAVIGYIGRLTPAKGVGLFIETIERLVKMAPEAQISAVIAGKGEPEYENVLRERAADLPIRFLGEVKPADFFSLCHVTAVPSLWEEPLGRVVIESMAYGRPVAVTPRGGLPELVDHRCGVVAADVTVSAFSAAVLQVVSMLQASPEAIFQAAIESARKYRPELVAAEYVAAYDAALAAVS
jgi:glycosyltransferase involved in cell wall biosynthesis